MDGNKSVGPLGVDIAGYGQMVSVVSPDISSTSLAINVHVRLATSYALSLSMLGTGTSSSPGCDQVMLDYVV